VANRSGAGADNAVPIPQCLRRANVVGDPDFQDRVLEFFASRPDTGAALTAVATNRHLVLAASAGSDFGGSDEMEDGPPGKAPECVVVQIW
jgi:hypothetical protein